jgi:hypothetical protein
MKIDYVNILKKVRQRYKEGLILNVIYGVLKMKIFEVNLFYLFQGGLSGETDLAIQPKIEPIVVEHLTPSDMRPMAIKGERDYSEEKMLQMLSDGCKCIGIKYKGNIVSYLWYDLQKCESKLLSFSFELKENEVYTLGGRTYSEFKGKALAPYLMYKTYKHLEQIGRTKFYGIIHFSNILSIKYHRKLNAKPIKLFLNVSFFNKYKRNFLLKKYSH